MKTLDLSLSVFSSRIIQSTREDVILKASEIRGLWICDENTRNLLPLPEESILALKPGEEQKTWDNVDRILSRCVEMELDRDSVIFGLGGGVVCDMAAFAASIYKRGCGLTLVPTTLLCMVDAGIGGKTGIDYGGYKNLVGTFYPASSILIVPQFLGSLPRKELLNGIVETIKHGIIGSPELLTFMEANRDRILSGDSEITEKLIWLSLRVKSSLVEEDLYEKGRRAWLNLGHTFGHALEAHEGIGKISHGEAVAWGLERALTFGTMLGITGTGVRERILNLLSSYGCLPRFGVDAEDLISGMKQDKKKSRGAVRIIIPVREGEVTVRDYSTEELIPLFKKLR